MAQDKTLPKFSREFAVSLRSKPDACDSEMRGHYNSLVQEAAGIRDRVKNGQDLGKMPALDGFRHAIKEDRVDPLYICAMSSIEDQISFPEHTVKVAAVSLKIAKGLDYNPKKMLQLGLAAFLENVGMYTISDHILTKGGKLDPEEMAAIRGHPEKSYEILTRVGEMHRWLAELSLQTHERSDGSGYPQGLRGVEISEFASIIGLADTFVALTSERPYRKRLAPADAVRVILSEGKPLFSTRILRSFMNEISLYPVGAYVKLNNGSLGQVISTEKNQPLRPHVKILHDFRGNKAEACTVIRLLDQPLLYIREALSAGEESLESRPLN
jgi:HD-GYP domain-containing protein (c-di-GMP phosphodiesterase class II)